MKVKGEVLNVLRFEDEALFDDIEYTVLNREHEDETRWGQVYSAVVRVEDPDTDYKLFRFLHEEPSTENNDPSAYDFDDDELVEVTLVEEVKVVRVEYVPVEEL